MYLKLPRLSASLLCLTRQGHGHRVAGMLFPVLLLLAGLVFFAPLYAQIMLDSPASFSIDGDSEDLMDSADDPDPLPPLAVFSCVPNIGKSGLTSLYRDAWAQAPSQPPATPPPIVG
ncbi:hypothetical protein [Methyloterricola oryzae]|uniref:hypothetical protein n=1 Tax=Methyloterricola oryzae TaxID=1495050 RepID=UPI0005EB9FA7|nr:hypothetical protein [Methyloterricola oryzae]